VTVTDVPRGIDAEQPVPQFRLPPPVHDAVTVPAPLPFLAMLKLAFLRANVALAATGAVMPVSVHVAPDVVVQPDHDSKFESEPGVAVSDSDAPESTETTQLAAVQFTLPSELVIVPLPDRESVTWIFLSVKVAVTAAAALRLETTHFAPVVDVQPVHVPKSESAPGAAVRVTLSP
jgi:hypothetical protein